MVLLSCFFAPLGGFLTEFFCFLIYPRILFARLALPLLQCRELSLSFFTGLFYGTQFFGRNCGGSFYGATVVRESKRERFVLRKPEVSIYGCVQGNFKRFQPREFETHIVHFLSAIYAKQTAKLQPFQ